VEFTSLQVFDMKTKISLALDRYDRHFPFFLGQLSVPDDLDLVPREVGMAPPRRDGIDRHRRMLVDREFDAAEMSLASYVIARSRGAQLTAIPVFPRRLFSQNHIFVRDQSPLVAPMDLVEKRIVVWAFQVTMSVLAKGDFRREYGADWRAMHWLALQREEVSVPNLPVTLLPPGSDPIKMLLEGVADAFVYPHPPAEAMSGVDGIRRLFPDPSSECDRHFRSRGYFPIMHLIVLQNDAVEKYPDLPRVLMNLWEEAKCISRDYYHDPGFSISALERLHFEHQNCTWGPDIWPSGVRANRINLAEFLEDMLEQGLLARPISVAELFHPSTLDT